MCLCDTSVLHNLCRERKEAGLPRISQTCHYNMGYGRTCDKMAMPEWRIFI